MFDPEDIEEILRTGFLLIGFVFLIVIIRSRGSGPSRCPACNRLGYADDCGEHECECGKLFYLNTAGRTVPTMWQAIRQPMFASVVLVLPLAMIPDWKTGSDKALLPIIAGCIAAYRIYRAFQTKRFKPKKSLAKEAL